MKGRIVAAKDLERASGVLAGFEQVSLPAELIHSQSSLTSREIIELVAFALAFNNGEVAISTSVGFASIVFQRMSDLAYAEEKAERTVRTIVERLVLENAPPGQDIETAFGIEKKTPAGKLRAETTVRTQLHALEIQILRSLKQILDLQRKQRLPTAIADYFQAKGIKDADIPFFLGELTNAVLRLARLESCYKRETVRPHLMEILKHKNPPRLVIPAGIF